MSTGPLRLPGDGDEPPMTRDQRLAMAERLARAADLDEEDPAQLELLLAAATIFAEEGEDRRVADVLLALFGYRWQYGYYRWEQSQRIEALALAWLAGIDAGERLHELVSYVGEVGTGFGADSSLVTLLGLELARRDDRAGARDAIAVGEQLGREYDESSRRWAQARRRRVRETIEGALAAATASPAADAPAPVSCDVAPGEPPARTDEDDVADVFRLFDWRYDLDVQDPGHVARADDALRALLARHERAGTLARLGELALRELSYSGAERPAAHVALALHRAGDGARAREIQASIAEPWSHGARQPSPVVARHKARALALLAPALGAVPIEFTVTADDDPAMEIARLEHLAVWHDRQVDFTCEAAEWHLRHGRWDDAWARLLDAFGRAWSPIGRVVDEAAWHRLDATTTRVLEAVQPVAAWSAWLRSATAAAAWSAVPRLMLLAWLGEEQARRGDLADARAVHDAILRTDIDSYDDIGHRRDARMRERGAARVAAAIAAAEGAGSA